MNNDPDEIAEGWNPDKLTNAQVGVQDGWRLLVQAEFRPASTSEFDPYGTVQRWGQHSPTWQDDPLKVTDLRRSYRTKLSSSELRAARGLSDPQPDRAPGHTPEELAAESLAQFFHETYERLAPEHGYETRKESAKPWADVPQQNKGLMIAVCDRVLSTSLLQALAGKDAEITRLQVNLEAAHSDSGKAYGQMVSAMTDLAAERAKREEAEEEREKYRIAATVLCGAHIGVPQAKCPGCERDANMQRAEQAEARLAEQKRVMLMEAAKCAELLDTFKTIRGGWVLQHEVAKLIDAAIAITPSAALQRDRLEVAERAYREAMDKAAWATESTDAEWFASQTRRALTGTASEQTDGKGEA